MNGLKRAAAYSIKPNMLERCGPKDAHKVLFDYVTGRADFAELTIREILKQFEVATPYYTLIARANSISDPFDDRVVEAYWLGNGLLDKVTPEAVGWVIEQDVKREGWNPEHIALMFRAISLEKARAHHSLSVLYFFTRPGIELDSLVTKSIQNSLDSCRVCSGIVIERGEQLTVMYQPLLFDYKRIVRIGKPEKKMVDWGILNPNDSAVDTGSVVAFHHYWAIECLSIEQAQNLDKYTKMTLAAVNP
ncbi:MAG TPA: DUF6390 family protein [bacterium]|jgi:hypothetical protein|nr:DUF6390 family protein [bacterium]HNS34032.1 DUF6390 family protein [bacterium]HNZ73122.1 DUF6390 family protein [bacterium]HOH67003.1 DUF6390 family protein [bacterium]HPN81549.1 DUF6390 family protein [bacterium]